MPRKLLRLAAFPGRPTWAVFYVLRRVYVFCFFAIYFIKSIKCNSSYYSRTVDEFPILFIIAALNKGTSKFSGIKDLANKESNRILEIKNLLKKINIKCKSDKNSMTIYGIKNLNVFKKKIMIDPKLDHRICQSAAILALATGINITIKNFETVNTSTPSFLKKIKQLGGKFEIKKTS